MWVDSQLVIVFVNAGVAGIIVVLFVLGYIVPKPVVTDLRAERDEYKAQAKAERERADAAVSALASTRDILAAFKLGHELGPPRDRDGP